MGNCNPMGIPRVKIQQFWIWFLVLCYQTPFSDVNIPSHWLPLLNYKYKKKGKVTHITTSKTHNKKHPNTNSYPSQFKRIMLFLLLWVFKVIFKIISQKLTLTLHGTPLNKILGYVTATKWVTNSTTHVKWTYIEVFMDFLLTKRPIWLI